MNLHQLVPEIVSMIGPLFGFIYCAKNFLKKGKALFLQIVTCAIGSIFLGRLFNVVQIISRGDMPDGFGVGALGILGGYLFFLSASFGEIDSLGDFTQPQNRKYSVIALICSAVSMSSYTAIYFLDIAMSEKIIYALCFVMLSVTSYYNIKQILVPDVKGGHIEAIRPYNALVLALSIVNILLIYTDLNDKLFAVEVICAALTSILLLLIGPAAKKGVEKWYQ